MSIFWCQKIFQTHSSFFITCISHGLLGDSSDRGMWVSIIYPQQIFRLKGIDQGVQLWWLQLEMPCVQSFILQVVTEKKKTADGLVTFNKAIYKSAFCFKIYNKSCFGEGACIWPRSWDNNGTPASHISRSEFNAHLCSRVQHPANMDPHGQQLNWDPAIPMGALDWVSSSWLQPWISHCRHLGSEWAGSRTHSCT